MPWGDWQFWVVTGLFLVALFFIARPFLPRRRKATHVKLTMSARRSAED